MLNPTKKWLFIKGSSVLLIPLMIWFSFVIAGIYDKEFNEIVVFFTTQPAKILISILFIVSYFFSALTIVLSIVFTILFYFLGRIII